MKQIFLPLAVCSLIATPAFGELWLPIDFNSDSKYMWMVDAHDVKCTNGICNTMMVEVNTNTHTPYDYGCYKYQYDCVNRTARVIESSKFLVDGTYKSGHYQPTQWFKPGKGSPAEKVMYMFCRLNSSEPLQGPIYKTVPQMQQILQDLSKSK